MRKTYLFWAVVALALAATLAALTGCGSSGDSDSASKRESPTPSAPTATPFPPTVTPVPDNLTAEQLRLLILAAADSVKDVQWDDHSGGEGHTTTFAQTKSYQLTSRDAQYESPPLNPTDKVDILETVQGKTYYRVNGGSWRYGPDEPPHGHHVTSEQYRFPQWVLLLERPVGGQLTYTLGQETATNTVTDLSVSAAANRGTNRCWALTVTLFTKFANPGQEGTIQRILTACEPDFLVTADAIHRVSGLGSDLGDFVNDNYRYNTGELPEIPTQAVEVHCEQYPQGSQEKDTCMFQ